MADCLPARVDPGNLPQTPPAVDLDDLPGLPRVGAFDLHAAMLADARKPTTRAAREQDLADLGRFLGCAPQGACALICSGDAGQANAIGTAYVRHMIDRGLAAATINRRLATVRRLVALARRFGVIAWQIDVDGLKTTPMRDTAGPGVDGMRALVAVAKGGATTPKGKRDWSILALLYAAGLRRFELAGLDVADADLDERRVRVVGKGRHEAEWLPMNAASAEALSGWLAVHPDPRAEAPLFVRLDRAASGPERLTADGVHHVIAELGRRAGLKRGAWPHSIRHASISRLAERTGGDLTRIQAFSRHSRIETVKVYVGRQRGTAATLSELLGEDLG